MEGRDVEGLSQVNSLAKSPVTPNRPTPGDDGISGISRDPMYIKVEKRMQEKQRELHAQVNKVEENTLGITTTTNALKNRTDELAAK